jgi:hypothetical protein
MAASCCSVDRPPHRALGYNDSYNTKVCGVATLPGCATRSIYASERKAMMKRILQVFTVVALTLAVGATPALAQRGGFGGGGFRGGIGGGGFRGGYGGFRGGYGGYGFRGYGGYYGYGPRFGYGVGFPFFYGAYGYPYYGYGYRPYYYPY